MNTIIIYGSYGYTGQLIVEECKAKNLNVILSGRNNDLLLKQSQETGYPYEVVEISDAVALRSLLEKGSIVIHCGGPFKHTAKAMADACIETKTNYTDITGEYQVFELLARYHDKAKEVGITILPGTGFDVVPSDCLALHLKHRLPTATHLHLGFTSTKGGMSRGTKKTTIEELGHGTMIRKAGKITHTKTGQKFIEIDFGAFKAKLLNITWGDISTAWRSTQIPNIEVFTGVTEEMIKKARMINYFGWLLRIPLVKNYLLKKVDKRPSGPSSEKRNTGRSFLWGKVWDDQGNERISRIETLNGYLLTAKTAVLIAEKILAGNVSKGYQTPATAFGANLILEINSTTRKDD